MENTAYAGFMDIGQIKVRGPQHNELLADLYQVIARHQAYDMIEIRWAHTHEGMIPPPGKVLLETTYSNEHRQEITIADPETLDKSTLTETAFRFKPHQKLTTMICVVCPSTLCGDDPRCGPITNPVIDQERLDQDRADTSILCEAPGEELPITETRRLMENRMLCCDPRHSWCNGMAESTSSKGE